MNTVFFRCFCPVAAIVALLTLGSTGRADPDRAREVFLRHYAAMGGLARTRGERTGYAEGTVVMDGTIGRFRQWQGRILRYRRAEDFSVIAQSFGDTGVFAWQVDTNGKRQIDRDPEALKRRRIQALFDDFAYLETPGDPFVMAYQGMAAVDGANCHVVKIANRINSDTTTYFFRTDDYRRVRTVHVRPDFQVHTDYSDYRWVQGLQRAFRRESRILPRDKTETVQLTLFRADAMVDPWLFAPQMEDAADAIFDNGGSAEGIGFEFIDNTIFLPVTMAGRTSLWVLDSGASMSLIDAGAANALGLTPAGKIRGYGSAAVFDLQFVKLPDFRVGAVRMASQTAFAFEGLSERFQGPSVTGILGYDFLSRFVTRIDYAEQTLSLYAPERFVYQGPGQVIDAPLKDRMFTVPIVIDSRYKGRWSLDLGAFDMAFHFPFAQGHGFLDRPGVDRLSAGLGGEFRERTIAFDSAELGGLTVKAPLIGVPYEKGRGIHGGGELAGNAGNRLLRHFVLYLDYARQQVIVEKGRHFNRRFARDQSGLQLTSTPGALARIVFVAPGTPAEAAGCRTGDLIVSAAGGPGPLPAGPGDLERLFTGPAGTRLQLTVERGGQRLALVLKLADLFAGSSKEGDVGS
ncbi:MAG: aspartyl protease family protein [Desulfobacterales bacterium]|nr:aspartyl protease family protein [Desulfobacterales bacterium]